MDRKIITSSYEVKSDDKMLVVKPLKESVKITFPVIENEKGMDEYFIVQRYKISQPTK